MPSVRGIIFDMDGTLVDSRLDYAAMRRDMGLPDGIPILEALAEIPDGPLRSQMVETMRLHELRGADEAILIEGVMEFLKHLEGKGIPTAILTRNSRESTLRTLDRMNLKFTQIVTRDDAPPKPDPAGVRMIARQWQLRPDEIIVIGDYLFDVQAGQSAGMRTVLFAPGPLPHYSHEADFILRHYREAVSMLNELHAAIV